MKINRFLTISALALFVASCGGTKEVQKTGTDNVKVTSATGSVSSTGKCKSFANKKEEKTMIEKYSLYREPFKAKNYAEGLENWTFVIKNFPGFRKTPFYDGIEMYKSQMEGADANTREDLQRKVMSLYSNLAKCHGDEGMIARLKANEYLKWDKAFGTDNTPTVTKYFEESLNLEGNNVEPSVLKYLWIQRKRDFVNKIRTESEVLAFGNKIKDIAKANIAANKSPTAFEDIITSFDKGLYATKKTSGGVKPDMTTCAGIESYFQKFVDAGDKKQCTQARLRMDKLGCTGSFYNAVLAISPKPPTTAGSGAANKFKDAITAYKAKDYNGAESLMQEALTMNPSANLKDQINYYIGNVKRTTKDFEGAARYYESSIAAGGKYKAKSYIGLGYCYLGSYSKCGGTPKDKASVAWVAADMFQNAMSDSESSAKASKAFATAQKYWLEKGDMFMAGIKEGETVNVGCWINKATTARGM